MSERERDGAIGREIVRKDREKQEKGRIEIIEKKREIERRKRRRNTYPHYLSTPRSNRKKRTK